MLATVPAVGDTRRVELGNDPFLPVLILEGADFASVRPTFTLQSITGAEVCGRPPADVVWGRAQVARVRADDLMLVEAEWAFTGPVGAKFTLPELGASLGNVWPVQPEIVEGDESFDAVPLTLAAFSDVDYRDLRHLERPTQARTRIFELDG